jgi:hypothetical protein
MAFASLPPSTKQPNCVHAAAAAAAAAAVTHHCQIRGSIKALFPDRDCFTLVRPMHDERALNRLNELQPEQLRPEFQEVGVQ